MPKRTIKSSKKKGSNNEPRVHHHTELVVKIGLDQEVMKLLIKDKHLEMVPKNGGGLDGFIFCSAKSVETTKRWRMILTAMLRLVDEAERVLEGKL